MTTETWKDIPGWEGHYEINDCGVIRSFDRMVNARGGALALRRGRVLRPVPKTNRYLAVTLADGNRRKQYFVHDLVLLAFIGPKPLGQHVCHYDCDLLNNTLPNLRYDTPEANLADTARMGRRPRGAQHPGAKLSEEQVREIRGGAESPANLAQRFGVTIEHISAIRCGKVWKHL